MGKNQWFKKGFWVVSLIFLLSGCGGIDSSTEEGSEIVSDSQAIVAGAGFTTFDATQGGCLDSPNGINCNNYESKDDVYMSGGPVAGGLSDGSYYFTVCEPGFQNGCFIEGAEGNLSDTTAGTTACDNGSGDDASNRTFTVGSHLVSSYTGTHGTGTSPNGQFIIQLMPYDDTCNEGGVYILAICAVGATRPNACKYDAFRIKTEEDPECAEFGVMAGKKYYDLNANGMFDSGEVGIAAWPIHFTDQVEDTVLTDSNGDFSVSVIADDYTFNELIASHPWFQTGNLVNQTVSTGGASAVLNEDKSYTVHIVDCSRVDGLLFGNLCVGAGGGHTLGFWSNKNGQSVMNDGGTMATELALLGSLNLRNASGANFDPANYSQFRNWLLNATATNMAYMLSAQLAAMELNVEAGFVNGGGLIYAPGTSSANVNGFAAVGAVMAEADAELGAHGTAYSEDPWRAYQEALKNALDEANNNRTFVQPGPASCPAPVFS